ncbi:MAG: UDP-N-acetylmuramate--L-alanine ligase [Prevotella sp.]|nr:UDP-N-acetylmuramate--L-alanine ligase [Prevotella sp.]MCM1075051.1 UDP-N-acetylmuramate--L-alanine ligase [Ruminococcus sp.]
MKENQVYFVGIGGIGMANLARYYMQHGAKVAGYDRTPSDLTHTLENEGAVITYTDDTDTIPADMRNPENTLVVYTPAVPSDNHILTLFRTGGFEVIKRAALLGRITRHSKGICVAGSHGKTTTSSMIAHILHTSHVGCNAFLGGILRNYNSNLIIDKGAEYSVIEADEYDRSFHQLLPYIAIVTSTDPDHLDIYGDEAGYLEGFAHFTSLIQPGGTLLLHTGLKLKPRTQEGVRILTYSATDPSADYHARNVRHTPGHLFFDFVGPEGLLIPDIELGVPVDINIDNAVSAIAASLLAGATPAECAEGIHSFQGPKRRFEIWLRPEDYPTGQGTVLIDDYAHSPAEVKASIASVKALYPGHKVTVVFQPHLYTRTRDFAPEFADALSEADETILCEIYPAREEPIPGITSQIIINDVKSPQKSLIERKNLLDLIKTRNFDILMTLGAADINVLLPDIKHILLNK